MNDQSQAVVSFNTHASIRFLIINRIRDLKKFKLSAVNETHLEPAFGVEGFPFAALLDGS